MLFKIAWRNIWRSKKRSLIIIGAVTIGLIAGIFLMAFNNGMIEQRVASAIKSEVSHIQLHHPEFKKDYDVKYYLENGYRILNQLQSKATTEGAAGRLIIKGMIASASGSSGITINGIIPALEQKVTNLAGKIKKGEYFKTAKKNEILLSEKLRKKLDLKLNNKAILTFQDKDGNIVSAAFRIIGIYKTVNTPYDETNVFVNIKDVDSLAGLNNEINEIALLLNSNKLLHATEQELKQEYPAIKVENWMEISPDIGLTVSVSDEMVYIFMGIILLALAFGIINIMMMAVLERTREIGMLLCLGMNKVKVFLMILLETVFLVIAGCPAGILLSFIAIAITRKTGISFEKMADAYASLGYSHIIYPSLTGRQFGIIMLLVIITAIVSALFPAWRALRLKPVESIRK